MTAGYSFLLSSDTPTKRKARVDKMALQVKVPATKLDGPAWNPGIYRLSSNFPEHTLAHTLSQ